MNICGIAHAKTNSAKLYIYIGVGATDLYIDTALDIFRFVAFLSYKCFFFRKKTRKYIGWGVPSSIGEIPIYFRFFPLKASLSKALPRGLEETWLTDTIHRQHLLG